MAFGKKLRKPSTVYNVDLVLHATFKVIEERGGYESQKKAQTSGNIPTSQFVLQLLKKELTSSVISGIKFDEIQEKVHKIKQHFGSPPSGVDDFLTSVYNIISCGMVSERMIGFIVALPTMYDNMTNRTEKLMKVAEKYAASKYLGEIGEKGTFTVKLVDIVPFSQGNVQHYIYKVADREGNFGFFFSNDAPEHSTIKLWDCFEFEAVVKNQEPNKVTGVKETYFHHVKIVELIGHGTEE